MMELQTLQEALKVEIQIHQRLVAQMKQDPQNTDLKKQLHDLQAKITSLSEKQKRIVEQLRKDLFVKEDSPEIRPEIILPHRSQSPTLSQNSVTMTPVIANNTLPLVLQATMPSMPASAVTPRSNIIMGASISHIPIASLPNSDAQNSPINLQTPSKPTNEGTEPLRIMSKNAVIVQATTLPIKVPQFVPPTRLMARPTSLLQVKPKPPASSTSASIAPIPLPHVLAAPQILQRPLLLTTQLASAPLPSSTAVHQLHILNGQPCATSGQLTSIVISAPATASPGLPDTSQTPQLVRLSPVNTTTETPDRAQPKTFLNTISPSTSPPPPSETDLHTPNVVENPLKLDFMESLGLVTHHYLEELQCRHQERKRRTTANPVYSRAVFEPEQKKNALTYLNTHLNQDSRKRGRPSKRISRHHQPLLCVHLVSPSHHNSSFPHPFSPPSPSGGDILKKEDTIEWPGTLTIVHSYISYKADKKEEKQKLIKWSSELRQERDELEQRVKQLNNSLTKCMDAKNAILAQQDTMQASLEKVQSLVQLIVGIHLPPLPLPPSTLPPTDARDGFSNPGASNHSPDTSPVDNADANHSRGAAKVSKNGREEEDQVDDEDSGPNSCSVLLHVSSPPLSQPMPSMQVTEGAK